MLAGTAGPAAPALANGQISAVLAVVTQDRTARLVRLDPVTLEPLPGSLELDPRAPFASYRGVASPDRRRIALADADRLRVVDLETMRLVSERSENGLFGQALAWPSADRLVGVEASEDLAQHTVVSIDPDTGATVERRPLRGSFFLVGNSTRRGVVVLKDTGLGTPLVLRSFDASERSVGIRFRDVRSGLEDGIASKRLPPGAERAARRVRTALADAARVPRGAVRSLSVVPIFVWHYNLRPRCGAEAAPALQYGWTSIPEQSPGFAYRVVVEARGKRHEFRVRPGGALVECPASSEPERAPAARNLLAGAAGRWHARAADVAVAGGGRHAYVVTAAGTLFHADLTKRTVRSRRLSRGRPGAALVRESVATRFRVAWVGPGTLVVTAGGPVVTGERGGVRLVDVRTGRVRSLDESGCGYTWPENGSFFAHGFGPQSCSGLTRYDWRGKPLYRIFRGQPVLSVRVFGAYAYVEFSRDPGAVHVAERATGRIVNRVVPEHPTTLVPVVS